MLRHGAIFPGLFIPLLLAQKPVFEVASIKPNLSGADSGTMGIRGPRFVATNVPLSALLSFTFTVQGRRPRQEQIAGLPSWGNSDRFDVEAISEDTVGEIPPAQARSMLQSMIEERFSIKFHRENRELPVYNLVLNKRGPRLSEDQTPPETHPPLISFSSSDQPAIPLARGTAQFSTRPGVVTITANSITISTLIDLLQGQTDRIVVDRTELKGLFDVKFEFAPGKLQAIDSGATSIFSAIQDLGFRLDTAKEPVEVIVIDSVQKPSRN